MLFRSTASIDGEWPWEDTNPTCATLDEAMDLIRRAMAEFWAYCANCGAETTEADRALYLPYADDIGVRCPACRAGDPNV